MSCYSEEACAFFYEKYMHIRFKQWAGETIVGFVNLHRSVFLIKSLQSFVFFNTECICLYNKIINDVRSGLFIAKILLHYDKDGFMINFHFVISQEFQPVAFKTILDAVR